MALGSAANATVVRLRATSDTYVRPDEPQTLKYSVVGDAEGLFWITEDGDLRLARDLSVAEIQTGKRRHEMIRSVF